jgi:hypothetical protein
MAGRVLDENLPVETLYFRTVADRESNLVAEPYRQPAGKRWLEVRTTTRGVMSSVFGF